MAGMTKLRSTVRQKSFGKTFLGKLTFLVNCGLWGENSDIRRKIIVRGVGGVLYMSRGTISRFFLFPGQTFIFLSFWDFWTFGFSQLENDYFFFGEVFATRLSKVYSRCSEEHFREKKLIFCEKLIIFAVFRLRKLLNFFLRHFLFFQRISEIWWKFFSRVPKIAFYQTRGLFLGRPFFVKTESVFGNWQNKLQL